jgi:hypothetical protein
MRRPITIVLPVADVYSENASGSSAPSAWVTVWPAADASSTSVAGAPSSASTCRHAPHGLAPSRVTTATARMCFAPAATARGDRVALGADGQAVGRVLDVAAGVQAPALVEHGGADAVAGVGRVRAQPHGAREGHQPLALRGRDHDGSAATIATISLPIASAPAFAARVTSSCRSGPG